MTDDDRLANIRSYYRGCEEEDVKDGAFIFLLRLLDERDATLTAYGTRIYRTDDGVLIRCESCAAMRRYYETDHKNLCVVMYREKDEAVKAARAAALEEAARLAEIQSNPITDWLAEDIRKL